MIRSVSARGGFVGRMFDGLKRLETTVVLVPHLHKLARS